MSALAQIYAMRGYFVTGSDAFLDSGMTNLPIWKNLDKLNIKFCRQNASGITPDLDGVILSSAINKKNPDYIKAQKLKLRLIPKQEFPP